MPPNFSRTYIFKLSTALKNHGNNAKICSRNVIPRGHAVQHLHAVIHFLVFKA